jgi:DNA-binding beta-propeller fold protein YncE
MKRLTLICATALSASLLTGTIALSQTNDAASSGPAVNGSPAWFLQDMQGMIQTRVRPKPDVGLSGCASDIAKYCGQRNGSVTRYCLLENVSKLSGQCKKSVSAAEAASLKATLGTPYCFKSPVCDPAPERGGNRLGVKAVEWKQTMGYTFAYPFASPEGERYGMVAMAVDSKDSLWGFQRNPAGRSQLFKWDSSHKLLLSIGDDVISHQAKAHGIAIDAQDNLWITDAAGATAKKISPDGKLLMTIGERGHRGDWDEAKGQRYLWEPLMVAFNAKGDVYIAQGHGHESPNDTDSNDPTNNDGAARILHLDRSGKFINQWYGNAVGQGKFTMAHGFAVDPKTGDVYIGDREEYRIVVYTGDGKFLRTMQLRNLICALYFDKQDNLWVASGWDGQFLKINKQTGQVLGAIGNGNGTGVGQFLEASYFVMDSRNNVWAGDTARGRITEMLPPKNQKMTSR